jgi:hypothetical protein
VSIFIRSSSAVTFSSAPTTRTRFGFSPTTSRARNPQPVKSMNVTPVMSTVVGNCRPIAACARSDSPVIATSTSPTRRTTVVSKS